MEKYFNILKDLLHSECFNDGEELPVLKTVRQIIDFYMKFGCHDTDIFYDKVAAYTSLKSRPLKVCCVCGIREMLGENESELKDALPYKNLLAVDKEEVRDFLALKKDEDDWLGALAQECFHIELLESENTYYHILDLHESSAKLKKESNCSLIREGKLTKLPACNSC